MIASTLSSAPPGMRITSQLGIVKGNAVLPRDVARNVTAFLKNSLMGGVQEYANLLTRSRQEALDRMLGEANRRGANAVVGVQFGSTEILPGAGEIFAYGTAVFVEETEESLGSLLVMEEDDAPGETEPLSEYP